MNPPSKRTPEQSRLFPAKKSNKPGDRHRHQTPRKPSKPGGGPKQKRRSPSNVSMRTPGISRPQVPERRVVSSREKSVTLTLDAPSADEVSIAGSFNDWTPQAMAKGMDGLWRITVQLVQGTYQYRFLVDGEWREDPKNPRKTLSESGEYNSVCDVL